MFFIEKVLNKGLIPNRDRLIALITQRIRYQIKKAIALQVERLNFEYTLIPLKQLEIISLVK